MNIDTKDLIYVLLAHNMQQVSENAWHIRGMRWQPAVDVDIVEAYLPKRLFHVNRSFLAIMRSRF